MLLPWREHSPPAGRRELGCFGFMARKSSGAGSNSSGETSGARKSSGAGWNPAGENSGSFIYTAGQLA